MLGRPTACRSVVLMALATLWLVPSVRAEEKVVPTGTWRWERELPNRTLKSTLKLKLKDEKLTGTYRGLGEEAAIQNAKLEGNALSFQVEPEFNGQKFTLQFQGKIDGDKLTGSVTAGGQELEWKATRSLSVDDVLGTWQFKITTGNGRTLTPSLKLTAEKDQLVGLYTSRFGDTAAQEIEIKDMELRFKIAGERDGNQYNVVYKGRLQGDSIKGAVEFDFGGRTGSIAFVGERKPDERETEEEQDEQESDGKQDSDAGAVRASRPPQPAPDVLGLIGRQIPNFTLKDFRGKTHSLTDYDLEKAVVVYFMGTECPLAKLYGPRVQRLAEQFSPHGVAVLGVNSNVQDSITELSAYARIHGIEFPILKDLNNNVSDLFGATRTPQVFLLDQQRSIRYYGRVDAQFTFGSGVGLARPQAQRNDLAIAIEDPDVSFIAWENVPGGKVPEQPVPLLAPDLAVEVLSSTNTAGEMQRKREEYFSAGSKLIWEVDHQSRTVAVYSNPSSPHECVKLGEDASLDGDDVLAGFSLSLRDLFAELERAAG